MQEQNVFLMKNNIVGMDDEKPQKVRKDSTAWAMEHLGARSGRYGMEHYGAMTNSADKYK